MKTLCVTLVCASALMSNPAHGQELEQAREIFEEGLVHSQNERWVPALEAFRRSLAITEMPVTLYNIASVLMRLGRMQEAVTTLERYQQVAEPNERAEADPLLEQARGAIRSVRATVSPEQTTVSVDGNDIPGEGTVRFLRIDPGTHLVRGRAQGYASREIRLAPDALELTLELPAELAVVMVRASEDARILLDGSERGIGETRLELNAGAYELRVEAEGAEPFTRQLDLDPGERIEVEAGLSRDAPLWKRGWFWGVIASSALAIVAGVILVATLPPDPKPANSGSIEWLGRP